MGMVFPFAQPICELGVAGVLPGRISLSSSGSSGFCLMCVLKAGSFSLFFSTGGCGSLLERNISNRSENVIMK